MNLSSLCLSQEELQHPGGGLRDPGMLDLEDRWETQGLLAGPKLELIVPSALSCRTCGPCAWTA